MNALFAQQHLSLAPFKLIVPMHTRFKTSPLYWPTLMVMAGYFGASAAQAAPPKSASQEEIDSIETIEIIASTPTLGTRIPKNTLASNVQTASGEQIENTGSLNLADFLNNNFASVHINDNQGNPFQLDLNYRGYSASPLLGTPQGISVYVDGVRMNQPFGDIVQWDLIPNSAIQTVSLFSGSNPVFGMNTLGGALSITTKDGRSYQGSEIESAIGSFGRRSLEFEHGQSFDSGLHTYLNFKDFLDQGWRDHSPSGVQQLFAKVGWHGRATDIKLSMSSFSSALTGNGLQQQELLAQNYASVFTQPDQTQNKSTLLNLEFEHALSDVWSLSGNAFYRNILSSTLNADLNTNALGEKLYGYNTAEGNWLLAHQLLSPSSPIAISPSAQGLGFPNLRCLAQAGLNTEPNEKCDALINRTQTQQRSFGFHAQASSSAALWGLPNRFTLGAALDLSQSNFSQETQFAYLSPERAAQAVSAYADGSQNSETAFDQRVQLKGRSINTHLLAMNTLEFSEYNLHLSTAGMWTRTRIENTDLLFPYASNYSTLATQAGLERGTLSGSNSFERFNPSIGLSYTPHVYFNPFVGYSESSRAPTSIELGCADPHYDCRLPNSMAGDPPLRQVVTKTWELGARGKSLDNSWQWSGALFLARNEDDILFVASSTNAGSGYFKNFGQTQRQGFEMSVKGASQKWTYGLNYTSMHATYESAESIISSLNPLANAQGQINILPGNTMPLMPSHLLNARFAYALTPSLKSGLSMSAVDSSFVRGNENNVASAKIPGYATLNWNSSWRVSDDCAIYANITNLMDKRYITSGALGPNAFASNGSFNNSGLGTLFEAPGAPRMLNIRVRFELH